MGMLQDFFRWFSRIEPKDNECMTVTVKKGDSLWNIADNLTGDGERWHELIDANPNLELSEDYVIQPGQILHVPHAWAED
jgi:nucleoid-associated protein YgaU